MIRSFLYHCVVAVALTAASAGSVYAQEIWSLEACIRQAVDKSLATRSSMINVENATIDKSQAKHARFPVVSASTNVGWNFGRTIDPTRNEFITETFFNNGAAVNANVLLYGGNRINNAIRQAELSKQASVQDLEQVKRDISLNVASIYLNILFSKENLLNAEKQLAITKNQADQLKKLIEVGNRPENDILDLESQLALNEQSVTEAKNNLELNFLNLKQLLRLEPSYRMDIVSPENIVIDSDPDMIVYDELLKSAVAMQPSVSAAESRLRGAMLGEKLAYSSFLPSLVGFGSLRSNYSNRGIRIKDYRNEIVEQEIILNNQPITIGFNQQIPNFETTPYVDQFRDNLSYGFGVSLNIPIYNNNTARASWQRAKLGTESALLNQTQVLETLKITVGQALADAKAAKARYLAAEKSRNAQNNLFNNATKRFEIGNLNTFELTRIKTQLETVTTNALIARYEYIFRSKVIDFYLGKPIIFVN